MASNLILQPAFKHVQDIVDLFRIQLSSAGDTVPFLQTMPAAASRCMLGHKHRVAAERGLLAVIRDNGGLQAARQKVLCMREYDRQAFLLQICQFFAPQTKSTAKGRVLQRGEYLIQRSHAKLS